MKNRYFTLLSLIFLSFITFSCHERDQEDEYTPVAEDQLPDEIMAYIQDYFPNETIVDADFDNNDMEWEVELSNHIVLDFNNFNQIEAIDSESNEALPESVIPNPINIYVSTDYPNEYVVSWEKDGSYQKVELSNDVEIVFDMAGNVISIDGEPVEEGGIIMVPQEIDDYINQYFPDASVVDVDEDDDSYEVTLSNGFELEFNKNYEIISIGSDDDSIPLPNNVIPSDVLDYINNVYPGQQIVGWEIENGMQKVELSEDFTLLFDMDNNFVGIDRD